MSGEGALDNIVSEFLLITCRVQTHPSKYDINVVLHCGTAEDSQTDHDDSELILLTTGSVAEFYIEPMLQHVGDIDIMFHDNTELAIPRGYSPPTQLPAEFHNCVQVFEIIDSHLPGYVYLRQRYLLTKCSDGEKYNTVEYESKKYFTKGLIRNSGLEAHGPASYFSGISSTALLQVDHVGCVRCLRWPPQAADWPKRLRNCGWPDSGTLDRVVSNGCDVVCVAHRQCRQHEWMRKYQWRLSFSRAEIVLINSWIPVQQIVYHMLRYFVKTERLTDCADNTGFSNYHIKTLMLWACERKSTSWWTDDVNLVRMCVQLLHILAECLNKGWYQHYFMNNCNLIDNSFNVTNIRDQLMSIDETRLSTWFMDNYIRKCLQLTPHHISRLFDDVNTITKLENAVSALVAWRLDNSKVDWCEVLDFTEFAIPAYIYLLGLTPGQTDYYLTEMAKMDSRFCVYFTAVTFLHIAYKSLGRGLNDELMDILATLCGQDIGKRRDANNSTSVLSLDIATRMMKVVANKSLSTMSLIEIELSKAYLCRALRCKDSDSDSIYCLANVYLAVLYYTTGQYQTAIDHCTVVTRSQDHAQCSSHVVQGEILPKVDDDVDNVLGLAVFYQLVRTAALNEERESQCVVVFTAALFAYYLHVKYLSVTDCRQFVERSSTGDFKLYGVCISDMDQLFIGDVLLFLSVSRPLQLGKKQSPKHQQAPTNANKYNTSDLVELLQKSAVEHLSTYRQLVAPDFGSVGAIVTTDFEALYAYKRGDYQRCLQQLSTQNVLPLLMLQNAFIMPEVRSFPQFIQLMDDEIVSLIALWVIVDSKYIFSVERKRTSHRPDACFCQLTLSLYLMTQCRLKLRYPVDSMAQILGYIEVAQKKRYGCYTLDELILKLTKRKAFAYIVTNCYKLVELRDNGERMRSCS